MGARMQGLFIRLKTTHFVLAVSVFLLALPMSTALAQDEIIVENVHFEATDVVDLEVQLR